MKRVHQSLSVVIFVITAAIGCASIPTQEMSDARQAIKAAGDVKADYYVPTLWAKVQKKLAQAERDLKAGQFFQARLIATLAKKQAVNAHNVAIAIGRAKRVWQAVTAMGYSTIEGRTLLEKAQVAARQGDVDRTIAFANDAYRQGKLALNQARLERAKILIDKVKARHAELHPDDLVILNLAEAAYHRCEGKKAYDLIKSLFDSIGN